MLTQLEEKGKVYIPSRQHVYGKRDSSMRNVISLFKINGLCSPYALFQHGSLSYQ